MQVGTAANPQVDVPDLTAAAVCDPDSGKLVLFLVNRDPQQELDVHIVVPASGSLSLAEALCLHDDDPATANTAGTPEAVRPQPLERVELNAGSGRAVLPACSWSMLRMQTD